MNEKLVKVFGEPEQECLDQMNKALEYGAYAGALMADCHVGYSVPIGGVIAYEGKICVNGVGFDIACGNKAVLTNANADEVISGIYRNMNEIQKHISFGVGRKNNEKVDHQIFDLDVWNSMDLLIGLKDKARDQLGTVGSGNHYVDIFTDELHTIWIGVHFGSRGLGHSICTHFIKACGGKDGIHAEPVILDEKSDLGEQYLKCMELAGQYAYAGRDWVCERVAKILRCDILYEVHNHHNFAWKERHFDKDLWVVRKGATPSNPGQRGFVGGSMGHNSFIITGMECEDNRLAMYSTVHGAGRVIGRKAAIGKTDRKTGEILKPGLVTKESMYEWVKNYGVELRGAGPDESPHCYKNIDDVLSYHGKTINICHKLYPIGVCMADDRTFDPYKD